MLGMAHFIEKYTLWVDAMHRAFRKKIENNLMVS